MKIHGTYRPELKPPQVNPLQKYLQTDDFFFLLRHGQIAGSDTRRFIGISDVDLDDTGISQTAYWQHAFSFLKIDTIYTSCLTRCRDTARCIAGNRKIVSHPALNEIDLGQWEGRPFDEIKRRNPEGFKQRGDHLDTFRPPDGESFHDVQCRAVPFLARCLQKPGTPLFVTHAGVIRVILCHITGLTLKNMFQINVSYGQLFVIQACGESRGMALTDLDDLSHDADPDFRRSLCSDRKPHR